MADKLFIGIDQGSSSTKGCLLAESGELLFECSLPVAIARIGPGIIEQNCDEILRSVEGVLETLLRFAAESKLSVAGAGLACQRSGVCAWEANTGKVVHNLISWADTRTLPEIERLKDRHGEIYGKSGMPPSPHYAGAKFALLQKKFPGKEILTGTLDSFLIHRLSAGSLFVTEDSMASRTMLYSLERADWDAGLCAAFGADRARLPAVIPSLSLNFATGGVPFLAFMGDQQAALFSVHMKGETALLNLGSIASLVCFTGGRVVRENGYISTVLCSYGRGKENFSYITEATTNACGSIVDFIVNDLKFAADPGEISALCERSRAANVKNPQTAFLPVGGTASPDWRYDLPLVFLHDPSGNAADAVRAAVENTGNFIASNIKRFRESGSNLLAGNDLAVTGGVSRLDYLLQYIADCTGLTLRCFEDSQATARGAALAAMNVAGVLKTGSLPAGREEKFMPRTVETAGFTEWCGLKDRVFRGDLEGLCVVEGSTRDS